MRSSLHRRRDAPTDGWERWFAWRPVRVNPDPGNQNEWCWVWWEWVERHVWFSADFHWTQYRPVMLVDKTLLKGLYGSAENVQAERER
jgi:hypothetical protein